MVFEELHAADRAVVGEQQQGSDEGEPKPGGRKLLDRVAAWSFLKSARMMIAPRVGSQVTMERM